MPDDAPKRAFTVDDARAYIAKVPWQFARTMPNDPHWYTLRKKGPRELDDDFVHFCLLIRREGTVIPWPAPPKRARYHLHYLEIGEFVYWSMEQPVHFDVWPIPLREDVPGGETILINRRKVLQEVPQKLPM